MTVSVARTEHSGPESGFTELFRGRWCILIPLPETPADAVTEVGQMWEVLAVTPHLPHLT